MQRRHVSSRQKYPKCQPLASKQRLTAPDERNNRSTTRTNAGKIIALVCHIYFSPSENTVRVKLFQRRTRRPVIFAEQAVLTHTRATFAKVTIREPSIKRCLRLYAWRVVMATGPVTYRCKFSLF